ncbi:MAG: hypothetical protein BMS9Abin13_140 [Patescibacteria group bacterium]|nr:MAG: hypothetical protein BMS9Abin13_140 [Patescibacteria group bacterium]
MALVYTRVLFLSFLIISITFQYRIQKVLLTYGTFPVGFNNHNIIKYESLSGNHGKQRLQITDSPGKADF